jgi:hypothetical protein
MRPEIPRLGVPFALALAALPFGACSRMEAAKEGAMSAVANPIAPPRAYRDLSLDGGTIRRVLVLPLADESSTGASIDGVNACMRDEMIKLRRFDVVQPDPSDATSKPSEGPKKTGRIEISTIIELGRRYGVDAVMFGSVDNYRPYAPPALGISSSLIDVQTGKIIWEVRDLLDAADRNTEVAMQDFFHAQASHDQTVMGDEIMASSPAWFGRFAARRVVRTLLDSSASDDVPR